MVVKIILVIWISLLMASKRCLDLFVLLNITHLHVDTLISSPGVVTLRVLRLTRALVQTLVHVLT